MKTWPHTTKTAVTLTKDAALKADQHNNNNHNPAFYSGEMAVSNKLNLQALGFIH
jgi:hypothetical protein